MCKVSSREFVFPKIFQAIVNRIFFTGNHMNLVLSLRSSVMDDVDMGSSGTIPIQCNKQLVNCGSM